MKRFYVTLIALFAMTAMCVAQGPWAVKLIDAGYDKASVIKVVSDSLGINQEKATELVNAAPVILLQDISEAKAEALANELEVKGATVDVLLKIDSGFFPDDEFYSYIEGGDDDRDGWLNEYELSHLNFFYVPSCQIESLQGIEYFTSLYYLNVEGNYLKSLDVSKNTQLIYLDVSRNELSTLDVSANTALEELNVAGNKLTAFDVSANTALEELNVAGNKLTAFDVSANTELEVLSCYGNAIKGAEMTTLINSLPQRATPGQFIVINSGYTPEQQDNVITKEQINAVRAKNWKPMDYNNGNGPSELFASVAINATNFPDSTFRNYVKTNYDKDNDGQLSREEMLAVTNITFTKDITSLTGIEYFTALKELTCVWTNLTELDLSTNTSLEKVSCSGNKLTKLNVTGCVALKVLSCHTNQIAELDLSTNKALEQLSASNNALTKLDASNNRKLVQLDCSYNVLTDLSVSTCNSLERLNAKNNKLTALDVKYCYKLTELYCQNNSISGNAMTALVTSLYNRTSMSQARLYIINLSSPDEGNVINTWQVEQAKEKNWEVKAYTSATNSYENYAGSAVPTAIHTVETDARTADNSWYSIDGKKLQTPPTQRGVYIHGGRKVVK